MTRTLSTAAVILLAASGLPPQLESTLTITNVTVIDVVDGAAKADYTVIVAANRIAGVGPSASTPVPLNSKVVDGSRRRLLDRAALDRMLAEAGRK